jgi:hypothetical protein
LGEARRWPVGLDRHPIRAKVFGATIAVATMLGTARNFSTAAVKTRCY